MLPALLMRAKYEHGIASYHFVQMSLPKVDAIQKRVQ